MFDRAAITLGIGPHSSLTQMALVSVITCVTYLDF